MILTLSLGAGASLACGYQAYKRYSTDILEREKQIEQFTIRHASQFPQSRIATVSFDLFDTLIGRDVQAPEEIFEIIESQLQIKDFANVRKSTQDKILAGGIDEIYEEIGKVLNLSPDRIREIKDFEWKTEIQHSVPIESNVAKLKAHLENGTQVIIVTDTLYSHIQVRELFNFPNVSIFSSRSGKKDGWVFEILDKYFDIQSHTGDNFEVDIRRLKKKGIYSQTAHSPTAGELVMSRLKEPCLAQLIRRLSLGNPYSFEENKEEYFWYRVHAAFTIPLLLYFVTTIEKIVSEHKIKRLVCVSRDCINLEKLLQHYLLPKHPGLILVRLDASRKLLRSQVDESYVSYIREQFGENLDEILVLDINGTYKSLATVCQKFFNFIPRAHYLSIQSGAPPSFVDKSRFSVAIPGIDTNIMERMNICREGSLLDWEAPNQRIRLPCEHEDFALDISESSFKSVIKTIPSLDEVKFPNSRIMAALLQRASVLFSGCLKHSDDPVLLTSFRPIPQLIKIYARIFSDYCISPKVSLLDLTDGEMSIRPLFLWKEYMKSRIEINSNDQTYEIVSLTITRQPVDENMILNAWSKVKGILGVYISTPLLKDLILPDVTPTKFDLGEGKSFLMFTKVYSKCASQIDQLPVESVAEAEDQEA